MLSALWNWLFGTSKSENCETDEMADEACLGGKLCCLAKKKKKKDNEEDDCEGGDLDIGDALVALVNSNDSEKQDSPVIDNLSTGMPDVSPPSSSSGTPDVMPDSTSHYVAPDPTPSSDYSSSGGSYDSGSSSYDSGSSGGSYDSGSSSYDSGSSGGDY